jgi:hypothetical protein
MDILRHYVYTKHMQYLTKIREDQKIALNTEYKKKCKVFAMDDKIDHSLHFK